MMDTAIIDLDNCISNDRWRWHLLKLHRAIPHEQYADYHEACYGDRYDNKEVIDRLSRAYKLVAFTSRPEVVRHKTEKWLKSWAIPIEMLLMRPTDNHEPCAILKRRMLLEWLPEEFNVVYAIDDRIDVLDMYANEGVKICQHVSIYPLEHSIP